MANDADLMRKQIYLTRGLNRRLGASAKKAGCTESAMIREALVQYLAQEERRLTPPEENPVLQMAGMFAGDPGYRKASAHVDEVLAESLEAAVGKTISTPKKRRTDRR